METIQTYLENMFAAFPDNPETLRAKSELLAAMEDKYNELKNEGKSENEAIGIVISEFGNIDELMAELGVAKDEKKSSAQFFEKADAEAFLSARRAGGMRIGLGVALILLGISALLLLETYTALPEGISVAVLFVCIAIAVALFIFSGFRLSQYETLEQNSVELSGEATVWATSEKNRFAPVFTTCITIGVILCVLCSVPVLLIANTLGVSLLFLLIAIGVFLFVRAGMEKGAYNILLSEGDYSPEMRRRMNEGSGRIVGIVASTYWPLMVCIFLIWGLVFNGWHIAWIIWPIAGILFGAFSAVTSAVMREK